MAIRAPKAKSIPYPDTFSLPALALAVLVSLVCLVVMTAVPAHGQETVASGTFEKKGFRVDGSWALVKQGNSMALQLDPQFATKNGPDLKFFLSPLPAGQVNGSNASEGALLIGELKTNRGSQTLQLPAGTDLSKYRSLVLHCEKYSKLWAASSLR